MLAAPKLSILFGTVDRVDSVKLLCETIHQHTSVGYEIIIVDGSQTQNVVRFAMSRRDIPIRIYQDQAREGYSKAYNKGARIARGTYIVWLNDDCSVTPGWAHTVVSFMTKHPSVGVGGIPYKEGRHRMTKQKVFGHYYANFGCIATSLWHSLHGLDEAFHSYGAETDLCFRVKERHLKVVPIPDVEIEHYRIKDDHRANVLTPQRAGSFTIFKNKWCNRIRGLAK